MDWSNILGLIACVCTLVIIALDWYTHSEKNVYAIVSKLIALAEETGLPGTEKMEMVVNGLYAIVPVAFKRILTKTKLQEIAQKVFDEMKSYALDYLARKAKEQTQGIEVERPFEDEPVENETETVVGYSECNFDCASCPADFGQEQETSEDEAPIENE